MKNDKKIIMFDFGGVVELHDDGSGSVYDYKVVFADAIRYAIGSKCGCGFLVDDDEKLYEDFSSDAMNDKLFRACSTFEELQKELGSWLCKMSGESSDYAAYFTGRFVQYVQTRNKLVPIDKDVVNLQKKLKQYCLVGGMTNISKIWSPRFHQVTDCIGYNAVWESWACGFLKPEAAAYKSVETMCGLSGDQILLIDDNEENVRAAIDNGWCAYKVGRYNVRDSIETVAMHFINDDPVLAEFIRTYRN